MDKSLRLTFLATLYNTTDTLNVPHVSIVSQQITVDSPQMLSQADLR